MSIRRRVLGPLNTEPYSDSNVGGGRTKQNFTEECDMNNILRRFNVTGHLPVRGGQPFYGDFSDVPSYARAHEAIRLADQAFMSLPPEVRLEFGNDPGKLLAAISDSSQQARLIELGVLPSPEVSAASKAAMFSSGQDESAGTEPAPSPKPKASSKASKADS